MQKKLAFGPKLNQKSTGYTARNSAESHFYDQKVPTLNHESSFVPDFIERTKRERTRGVVSQSMTIQDQQQLFPHASPLQSPMSPLKPVQFFPFNKKKINEESMMNMPNAYVNKILEENDIKLHSADRRLKWAQMNASYVNVKKIKRGTKKANYNTLSM